MLPCATNPSSAISHRTPSSNIFRKVAKWRWRWRRSLVRACWRRSGCRRLLIQRHIDPVLTGGANACARLVPRQRRRRRPQISASASAEAHRPIHWGERQTSSEHQELGRWIDSAEGKAALAYNQTPDGKISSPSPRKITHQRAPLILSGGILGTHAALAARIKCLADEGGMGLCCLRQAIGCARNLLEALGRDSSEE